MIISEIGAAEAMPVSVPPQRVLTEEQQQQLREAWAALSRQVKEAWETIRRVLAEAWNILRKALIPLFRSSVWRALYELTPEARAQRRRLRHLHAAYDRRRRSRGRWAR